MDILLSTNANKSRDINISSQLAFNLPFLIFEFSFAIIIIFYLFPSLPQQLSYYVLLIFIIYLILVTIIIIICLDIFDIIRGSIFYDLREALAADYYSLRYNSSKYGEDYMYYQKIVSYGGFTLMEDQLICAICHNEYIDDDMVYDKQLLHCGHLYHKECLHRNEGYQWKNNKFKYSQSECAHCRAPYHTHSQKFDFDEHFWKKTPSYMQPFDYFGRETSNMLYWNFIQEEYGKYEEQDPSKRSIFGSILTCLMAVILNIYNLVIKFGTKCIKYTF